MNYKYIEAPQKFTTKETKSSNSIFLAGTITGGWDWQKVAASKLQPFYHVFNPRRANFDTSDTTIEKEQITWEYNALKHCKTIMFWFSYETMAPITLFELGTLVEQSNKCKKKLIIGVDKNYARRRDIIIQMELRSSFNIPILDTLEKTIEFAQIMY